MSEGKVAYRFEEDETKLLWLAKRFIDLSNDIEKLNEEEKEFVLKRIDELNSYSLVECSILWMSIWI